MKKLLFISFLFLAANSYSQGHIGVMGGTNFENDYSQIGVGLNYMLNSKISLGAMAMVTPFEGDDDYMLMYNLKYKLGRFYLVGGLMTGDMEMSGMHMSSMNETMRMDSKPYYGIEYRPFKSKMLKIYYNHSDMMQSLGIMLPIFNLGKKMHMHN